MSEPQQNEPFLFNTDFGGENKSQTRKARAQEAERTAFKREYDKGYEAGLCANNEQQMEQINQGLKELKDHLSDHLASAKTALEQYRITASQLGKYAAIKLAHKLIANDPKHELEQFFKEVIELLPKEETLTLAVSSEMISMIDKADTDLKLLDNLTIVEDESLSLSDAQFTWASGGIGHKLQSYTQAVDDAVERFISAAPCDDQQATKPQDEPNAA